MVSKIVKVGGIQIFVSKDKWEKGSFFLFIAMYRQGLENAVEFNFNYNNRMFVQSRMGLCSF